MDDYESRYQTRLDTISKMPALKSLIGPRVRGDKFIGAEYMQDDMGLQETCKQVHNFLFDSQLLNWPASMEITAIMDSVDELIGEAYTRNPATRVKANEMAKRARHEANKDIECFKR